MTKSKSEDNQSNISNQNNYSSNNPNSKPKKESELGIDKHPLINLSKNFSEISQSTKDSISKKNLIENKFYISQEINKGPWTQKENKILVEYVKKFGAKKWNQCAEFIKNRTGKQCREHWKNCLNPEIKKGDWGLDEDLFIMVFYQKCHGSWREMIHLFEDRTENSIKNRFFSQLRKIAANDLGNNSKKRSVKMDLKNLMKYLEQGIEEAKNNFMIENKMNEEEFKNYIKKAEIKLINKKKEKRRKRTRISKKIINKNNNCNLLGKKREKISPEKKEEIIKEEEKIINIMPQTNEETKITDLKTQNQKKELNKESKEIKNTNNVQECPSEENENNYINKLNNFLEMDENEVINLLNNSFINFDSNEDEKMEEPFENSDEFSKEFFPYHHEPMLKRTNSDFISKITTDNFFFQERKR